MEKHWSTVCVLIFVFGALGHFNTVLAAEADGNLTAKPGVCPRRLWGVGLCAEFCSSDRDCPDDEKCCHNGCGHQCMAPYTVKKGRCPLPPATPMCAEYCYHDGQCPEEQKCCRTTCGHACSEPC
ncbi:WAP four-disulfide core domain protein 3 [Stegastes partitus]|uniref:WAP four-disulfide core domain protein 18-like n=1 Tax=Stegastes partitus TaxID=144197 RepID=A0A3B4ZZK0_9TELE|nr:PREDICTED: WAP four-disulfide core domain protein 18-like [Stegastes partitus]